MEVLNEMKKIRIQQSIGSLFMKMDDSQTRNAAL
jgi:hypothetical protein